MTLGCFILEDQPGSSAVWEEISKKAGFEMIVTASNVKMAIEKIALNTGKLVAYVLDMSTPFGPAPNEEPHPYAGPMLRDHLITNCGVSPNAILLISNIISEYDLRSCSHHQIDPSLILKKSKFSVDKIKQTFASVLQKQ